MKPFQLEAARLLESWAARASLRGATHNPWATLRWLAHGRARGRGNQLRLHVEADYVEQTWGFAAMRPLLTHVLVHGQPVHSYRFRLPGERLSEALLRHGLGPDAVKSRDGLADVAQSLYDAFRTELELRIEAEPIPSIDWSIDLWPDKDDGPVTELEYRQLELLTSIRVEWKAMQRDATAEARGVRLQRLAKLYSTLRHVRAEARDLTVQS